MITQLDLLHFKCFGFLKLPLAPLTLLSGTNASGKSTVLQSLVLLQQTMQTDEWSTRLLLNGSMVNFGTVADTLHQQARGHFAIGVVGESSNCLWIFSGEREEMSFAVESIGFGTSKVEKPSSLRYLLPPNPDPATFSLVDRIRSLSYISAEREGPRELYPLQDSHRRPTVGPTGEDAVSVLLRAQDKWVASPLRLSGATTPLLRAQPERARTAAQGPRRHPLAAGRAEGDVGRVAQDGMPAQGHNLPPQIPAAQPLVAQHVHPRPLRHRRRQQPQQATEVRAPGLPSLGTHHMPGHRQRLLAVDHAHHQGHPRVLVVGGVQGQD